MHISSKRRNELIRKGRKGLALFLAVVLAIQCANLPIIVSAATDGGEALATVEDTPAPEQTPAEQTAPVEESTPAPASVEESEPVETTPVETTPAAPAEPSEPAEPEQPVETNQTPADPANTTPVETEQSTTTETPAPTTEQNTPADENGLGGGNLADNNSAVAAPAEDTTATVALALNQSTLAYEGTTYTSDQTQLEAPANQELKFTVAPTDGFEINTVKQVATDGVETELTADANSEYTIAADKVADGLKIDVATTEVPADSAEKPVEDSATAGDEPATDETENATEETPATEESTGVEDATEGEEATEGDAVEQSASNGISLLANTENNYSIAPNGSQDLSADYQRNGKWSIRKGTNGSWQTINGEGDTGRVGDATLYVSSNGSGSSWDHWFGKDAAATFSVNGNAEPGDVYQVRYGTNNNYRISTFTVSSPQPEGSYTVYFYSLIPGKTLESTGSPDSIWNGMGTGSVTGLNHPDSYPNDSTDLSGQGVEVTFPSSYPDITYGGRTYEYAAPGSGNENTEGYYTIEWIRLVKADGANAGANDYNPVVNNESTFHYDGQIFINEKNLWTVTWRVQMPEDDHFTIQTDYSRIVEDGTRESSLPKPQMQQSIVQDRVTYIFDGWYTDENCTETASFNGQINGNKNYYAKYVAQNNDELTYDGNGATSGSTSSTGGVTGRDVTVAENGFDRVLNAGSYSFEYTFAGWNTRADGTGVDYEPGYPYELTEGNDVLYAQWEGSSYLQYDMGVDTSEVEWNPSPSTLIDKMKVNGVNTGNPITIGSSNNFYLDSQQYDYQDTVTIPKDTPQLDGYTFTGWADGETIYQPGDSFKYRHNEDKKGDDSLTLKAQWDENTVDVTYTVDPAAGGTISNDSDTIGQDTANGLEGSSVAATNPGYTFDGWYVGDTPTSRSGPPTPTPSTRSSTTTRRTASTPRPRPTR